MKNKKKLGIILGCVLLVTSSIGSFAAGNVYSNRSHGVLKYNENDAGTDSEVVINANDIGYYIYGLTLNTSGWTSKDDVYTIITNSDITADSIVEIYYNEASKGAVARAAVTYSQTAGKITCTFKSQPTDDDGNPSDIVIDYIKITNPSSQKSE